MKNRKLISMTDFVTEQAFGYGNEFITAQQFCDVVTKYARFLKQPLTLEMFMPCDENGNKLKGKPLSHASDAEWDRWEKERDIFEKAKEQVIFSYSPTHDPEHHIRQRRTVEHFAGIGYELTDFALKGIYE